jgi:hypothetical protein
MIPSFSESQNERDNYEIAVKDILCRPSTNTFSYRGYNCIVVLSERNTWDSYVTLESPHVCYNIHHENTLNDTDEFYLIVHGGLAYSYTNDGETVIGFHTCRIGDFIPSHKHGDINSNFNYTKFREFDWVVNETVKLVDQIYFYNENIFDISFLFREEREENEKRTRRERE